MTDFTANIRPARRGHHSAEHGVYFGLVFAASLPEAAVRGLVAAAHGDFSGPGLIRRARTRAREITPRIFDC